MCLKVILYTQYTIHVQYVFVEISLLYNYHIRSIYLQPGRTVDENAAYVNSVISETVRNAAGRMPVYGFHWNCK